LRGSTPSLTLATGNQPVDTSEIEIRESRKQGLRGHKTHGGWHAAQELDAPLILGTLDRHAHLYVAGPVKSRRHASKAFGAFCEDLVRMLRCPAHHVEYQLQILLRHLDMKQVRHAVHEDRTRTTPTQRNVERVRPER